MEEKVRVEFTLNPSKDQDIINLLNSTPYAKATFIKMVLREKLDNQNSPHVYTNESKIVNDDSNNKKKKTLEIDFAGVEAYDSY